MTSKGELLRRIMSIACRLPAAAAVFLAAGLPACGSGPADGTGHAVATSVRTFDDCVEAGGRIAMKDPPVCYLGDRSFDEADGEARAHADAASVYGADDEQDALASRADDGKGSPAPDAAVSVTPDALPEPARRAAPSADRYALDPDPGHCEAAIVKYWYDRTERACKAWAWSRHAGSGHSTGDGAALWGGCGGVVPFETRKECEAGLVPAE